MWLTPGGAIIDPLGFLPFSYVMKGRPFITRMARKKEPKGVLSEDLHAFFLLAQAAGLRTVQASATSSRTLGFAIDWPAVIRGGWYSPARETEYGGKGPTGSVLCKMDSAS